MPTAPVKNGRPPMPDIDTLTLSDLREHVEKRRLAIELQAMEASAQWFDSWVDPREPYLDDPDFWQPLGGQELVPVNQDNRGKGEVLPIYLTENGLKLLRDQSRRLLAYNEFAINAVENRVSYVVGTGFQYKAVCESPQIAAACQAVIDEFASSNKLAELEQEAVRRCDEDGETIFRLFDVGSGRCVVRVVEPEHLATPAGGDLVAGFGVQTAPEDVCTVVAYHIRERPDVSLETTPVEPSEIVHIKLNVKRNAKRGLPTLVPVRKNLERAEKLLRNMSIMAQVRATYAVIRRHKGASRSAVETMQAADVDLTYNTPFSTRARNVKIKPPGSEIDAPDSTTYEFPSTGADAAGLVQILQAELRAVAARLVMPEYMLTTDASNANYSSTMVAEAPSTKNFERLQKFFAGRFGDGKYGDGRECGLLWRVLAIAVQAGRLPEEVLAQVTIQAEGPTLVARDKSQETARAGQLNQAGVLSKATWSKWEGVDREQEKKQIEAEQQEAGPPPGSPGAPGGDDQQQGDAFSMDDFDDPNADADQADDVTEADATAGGGFSGTLKDSKGREYTYQNGKRIAHPDGATAQHLATADRVAGQRHGKRQAGAERKKQWRGLKKTYHQSVAAADQEAKKLHRLNTSIQFASPAGMDAAWSDLHYETFSAAWDAADKSKPPAERATAAREARRNAARLASRLSVADTAGLEKGEQRGNRKIVARLRAVGAAAARVEKHMARAAAARGAAEKLTNLREDKQDALGRWHDDKGHLVSHGSTAPSGGAHLAVQPDAQGGGRKKGLLARLGKAGRGVRIAKYWEHKVVKAISSRLARNFKRLPKPMQAAVKGVLRTTFSSYIAGNAAARAVAIEVHGEKHGRKVGAALMAADYLAAKTVVPTVALVAPAVAGAAYWFPMASMTYLAYSTAKNPRATFRAAAKAVQAARQAGIGKTAKAAVLGEAANVWAEDDIRALFDAFDRHQDEADWYEAAIVAALGATQGDIPAAIALADHAADTHDTAEDVLDANGRWHDDKGHLVSHGGGPKPKASRRKPATDEGKAEYEAKKKTNDSYRRHMAGIVMGDATPAEAVHELKVAIKGGKKLGAGPEAVWESATASLAGTRLVSHGAHGFDTTGTIAGVEVLLDAKHSGGTKKLHVGYSDKGEHKLPKVVDWKANGGVPAYLVLVKGHGVFLHVGIDPTTSPSVKARGSVKPGELGKHIDGSGNHVPFVLVSDRIKSVDDLAEVEAGDVSKLRKNITATIKGIDMAKLKEHVGKQVEGFENTSANAFVDAAPEATGRAVAKSDTALAAIPDEVIAKEAKRRKLAS